MHFRIFYLYLLNVDDVHSFIHLFILYACVVCKSNNLCSIQLETFKIVLFVIINVYSLTFYYKCSYVGTYEIYILHIRVGLVSVYCQLA